MARKIKLTMVEKGELGHIYPQTVSYNVGKKISFWWKMSRVII